MDKLQFLVLITLMSSCERRLVSVKKLGSRVRVGSVRVRIRPIVKSLVLVTLTFNILNAPIAADLATTLAM